MNPKKYNEWLEETFLQRLKGKSIDESYGDRKIFDQFDDAQTQGVYFYEFILSDYKDLLFSAIEFKEPAALFMINLMWKAWEARDEYDKFKYEMAMVRN